MLTKAKPVIFNTHDVRATLDGNKTMFRRAITAFNSGRKVGCLKCSKTDYVYDEQANFICCAKCGLPIEYKVARLNYPRTIFPLAKVDDVLYVREPWMQLCDLDSGDQIIEETLKYYYAADKPDFEYNYFLRDDGTHQSNPPWKSPVTMPKEAARLFLKVTGVRIERLQDITLADCMAEGMPLNEEMYQYNMQAAYNEIRGHYSRYWDERNKKKSYDWQSNPYVWVYQFERIEI